MSTNYTIYFSDFYNNTSVADGGTVQIYPGNVNQSSPSGLIDTQISSGGQIVTAAISNNVEYAAQITNLDTSINWSYFTVLAGALSVVAPILAPSSGGGGGSGVTSIDGLSGVVGVTSPDMSVTIGTSGNNLTLEAAGGGGGVTSLNSITGDITFTSSDGSIDISNGKSGIDFSVVPSALYTDAIDISGTWTNAGSNDNLIDASLVIISDWLNSNSTLSTPTITFDHGTGQITVTQPSLPAGYNYWLAQIIAEVSAAPQANTPLVPIEITISLKSGGFGSFCYTSSSLSQNFPIIAPAGSTDTRTFNISGIVALHPTVLPIFTPTLTGLTGSSGLDFKFFINWIPMQFINTQN